MIGFIDSGAGGLNVLLECAKLYKENFVYLADNKNAPYGNLTKRKLLKITQENIDLLINKYNVNVIVIACNTVSTLVGNIIKEKYNIPIILMAFNINNIISLNKDVLFFGTKNTIKNNKEINYLLKNKKGYTSLYIKDLAKQIDLNINKLNNILPIIKNKIINKKQYNNVKTICLCCTHFKYIKKQLKMCFKNITFYEYEKDVALKTVSFINPYIKKNTYKIVLTRNDYPFYITLKKLLVKGLNE